MELEVDAGIKFATSQEVSDGLDSVVSRLKPKEIRFTPRPAFGSRATANSATVPFQIDIDEPPPGRVWEIVGITISGTDDNTTVAGKVALYTGALSADGSPPSLSGLRIPVMTIPFWDDIGGRRMWCQPGERMFVNVSGVPNGQVVNVRVDVAEWRQGEVFMSSS